MENQIQLFKDWLAHYGVKGQKWGITRSDKQLSAAAKKAGRKRVEDSSSGKSSNDGTSPKKKVSEMSDDELRNKITRLRLEKELASFDTSPVSRKTRAINFTSDILKRSISDAAPKVISAYMIDQVNKSYSKSTGRQLVPTQNQQKKKDDK